MKVKLLLVIGLLFSQVGCAYKLIDSGHCGVRVTLNGSDRGVNPTPIGVGRTWYFPLNEEIHEFPIFEQTVKYQKSEGTSFTISSSKSAQIDVDVSANYEVDMEKAPVLFAKLRQDLDVLEKGWLKTHVREAIANAAEKMDTMAILGEGKSELLDKAKSKLNKDLEEYGIEFKTLAFSNTPQPEAKIQVSIDESVQAQQRAVAAQNKVLEAKALADQEIEKARGKAESVKIAALAQLEAAASEAKANELLSKSLTSELVRVKMIEKWDGALPKFSGESTPLISFDSVKK